MLNRINALAASATLITVGILAFSGLGSVHPSSKNFGYSRGHSLTPFVSDRSNFLPTSFSLNKPTTLFCYLC